MNRENILMLAHGDDPCFAMLEGLPHVIAGEAAAFSDATKDTTTVIFNWSGSRQLLRAAFAACRKVRWVHSRSAGVDNILFPELVESRVPITNGSGVFSQSLGEFALAAMLFFAKDFRRMLRNQAANVWEQFDVEEIAGKTVGIVGYGDIGHAVAARARAMGMHVITTKRHLPVPADPLVDAFYQPGALREMLALCDYVVAAAPLTEETMHMIGDEEFGAMKREAVVINVGRGPVIDEAAMVRALTARRIKGAGLDVFEHEPLPLGNPLYRLENVLLSPHCADHTCDWLNQAMRFFLEQYGRFVKGEPLKNVVNKRLGY